jgi:rhamnosyltransferase
MTNAPKIYCILVTYHPDLYRLHKVMEGLVQQTDRVIIVDNGSYREVEELLQTYNFHYIPLPTNQGIAQAQNIGIQHALEQGADYLMLSDQDTIYPANYINQALQQFQLQQQRDPTLRGIGPRVYDRIRSQHLPFLISYYPKRAIQPDQQTFIRVKHLIASGSFYSANAFQEIGLLDPKLFIDWVDLEWSLRAAQKGYSLYGCGKLEIHHHMGDQLVQHWGYRFSKRSDERNYYRIRNGLYLFIHSNYFTKK